jgi:hypothetical protein
MKLLNNYCKNSFVFSSLLFLKCNSFVIIFFLIQQIMIPISNFKFLYQAIFKNIKIKK